MSRYAIYPSLKGRSVLVTRAQGQPIARVEHAQGDVLVDGLVAIDDAVAAEAEEDEGHRRKHLKAAAARAKNIKVLGSGGPGGQHQEPGRPQERECGGAAARWKSLLPRM